MVNTERIDDPEEALRTAIEAAQARIWTAMPGIVDSVDLDKQTISAQIAIQGQQTDEKGNATFVNLPILQDVPLVFPRAGGFAITFPVKQGDEVLVVFGSRCLDSWWQSGGIQAPAEFRMHDLSDGFAIPGPTSQPKKLAGVSDKNVQLRTEDGSYYVELTPDGGINIKGKKVTLDGDVKIDGIVFKSHIHGFTGVKEGTKSVTEGPKDA